MSQIKDKLTRREVEVLQLVAIGKSAKEIATLLGISTKTVDNHVTNMHRRLALLLGLEYVKTAHVIHYALAMGYVRNIFDEQTVPQIKTA